MNDIFVVHVMVFTLLYMKFKLVFYEEKEEAETERR